MNSEHPNLPLSIARLARSAAAVTPLERPSVRLARWAAASTSFALVTVAMLGARADVAAQMTDGWFVARATATCAIGVAAAIVAFLTSVPGVEPSRGVRVLPWAAGFSWAVMLAGAIAAARSPLALLLQTTPHPSCALIIATAALSPWVMLVRMLRHGAPLHPASTAAYAGLASMAVGALAAQFVCANDAAAHHLLWHFTPVVLLTAASVVAGSSFLERRWAAGAR